MTGRGGRPPKPDDERLTEAFNVRVTKAKYDAVCRKAMAGRVSLRAYVRALIDRDLGVSGVKT
jgi:hypothetical protein